jgi:Core-2/I-Branching enzyme
MTPWMLPFASILALLVSSSCPSPFCSIVPTASATTTVPAPIIPSYEQDETDADETDSFVLKAPCPENCHRGVNATQEATNLPRIFYLVLAHDERTLFHALYIFRSIRHSRNILLIHLDAKTPLLIRQIMIPTASNVQANTTNIDEDTRLARRLRRLSRELLECTCGMTVRIESVHSVEWSKWSMNFPTLYGMQVAISEYAEQWDIFINLSGDSLPVFTPNRMAERLQELVVDNNYNFVTSRSCETGLRPTSVYEFPTWWHKRAHYTRQETEADPVITYIDARGAQRSVTVTSYFGSQWIIVQYSFVDWLVQGLQQSDSLVSRYRDYLQQSEKLMTDETFIPSLLMVDAQHNNNFSQTVPHVSETTGRLVWRNDSRVPSSGISAVRFERMDEHVPSSRGYFVTDQKYEVSWYASTEGQVPQPRPWGPYYLGVYDLAGIRESGALFIRKVSMHVDDNLFRIFPVDDASDIPDIGWPREVAIGSKPDWEKRKAELIAKAASSSRNQGSETKQVDASSNEQASPKNDDSEDEEL